MITIAQTEDEQDMTMAKDIAETLHSHYPGYIWAVNVKGGVAIIKNLHLSTLWGMVLKYNHIKGDAGARKKAVIRAGGELLERGHFKRGERQINQRPQVLEGVKNYKPIGVH